MHRQSLLALAVALALAGANPAHAERWSYGVEPPPSWFSGALPTEPEYIRVSWRDVRAICASVGLSRIDNDRACVFWRDAAAIIVLPDDTEAGETAALDLHERFHVAGFCHPRGRLFGWVYCGVPAQKRES